MSWKQYGGMKKMDHLTNLNVVSIATDDLTVRNAYQGLLNICGELHVSQRLLENQSLIGGNITVDKNILLQEKIILGGSQTFLKGDASGVGINVISPNALLDISTNQTNVLKIYTSHSASKSILSQTGNNYGLIHKVDPSCIAFDFYHQDHSLLNVLSEPEASIRYEKNAFSFQTNQVFIGTVLLEQEESTMIIKNTGNSIYTSVDGENNISFTPTMRIYDETKNPLFILDNSSTGLSIGGGSLNGKAIGTIGWLENSNYIPHHTYLQGNSDIKCKTTTGINTYNPKVNKYSLDVNGPVSINHSEIHIVKDLSYVITGGSISNGNVVSIGTNGQLLSSSDFINWYGNTFSGTLSNLWYGNVVVTKIANGNIQSYTSQNNGQSWIMGNISLISGRQVPDNISTFLSDSPTLYYSNRTLTYVMITSSNGLTSVDISCTSVQTVDKYISPSGNTYVLGGAYQGNGMIQQIYRSVDTSNYVTLSTYQNTNIASYIYLKAFGSFIVAVGKNYISYTTSGTDFSGTDFSFNSSVSLNHLDIFDLSRVIVVGDAGFIAITTTGGNAWTQITSTLINGMGNAPILLDSNYNLLRVSILDKHTFLFISVNPNTIQSRILLVYAPKWFSPDDADSLLEIDGHILVNGDIKSTQNIIHAWNTVPDLYLGKQNGNIYLGNTILTSEIYLDEELSLSISKQESTYKNFPIRLHRDVLISGNLTIEGNSNINTSIQSTFLSFNSDSFINNLQGTTTKTFSVKENGNTTLGCGFYIYNTTSRKSVDGQIDLNSQQSNDGFIKISDVCDNILSFRSTGDNNVVSMAFPYLKTKSETKNSLLLLHLKDGAESNVNDNFYIISSDASYSSLPISVESSLYDIIDVSMSGNIYFKNSNIPLQYFQNVTSDVQNQLTNRIQYTDSSDISLNGNVTFSKNMNLFGNVLVNGNIITPLEFSYLDGITENIQNQFMNRIQYTDSSDISLNGNVTFSKNMNLFGNVLVNGNTITPFEFSCLDGVTQNIQNQFMNRIQYTDSNDVSLNGNVTFTKNLSLFGNVIVNGNTITPLEFSRLDGITENIQSKLNGLQSSVTAFQEGTIDYQSIQTFSQGIVVRTIFTLESNLDLFFNGNTTSITREQLSYLQDVTGNIQNQLNQKIITNESRDLSFNGNVSLNRVTLLGNLLVYNTSLAPQQLSYLQDVTGNIQNQLFNRVLTTETRDISLNGNTYFNKNIIINGNLVKNNLILPLDYLSNVTSDIQQQLNTKTNNSDTSDVSFNGNVYINRLLLSGNVNNITPTQLNYLSGATSNIQEQIISLVNINEPSRSVTIGNLTIGNATVSGNLSLQSLNMKGTMYLTGNITTFGNLISPLMVNSLYGIQGNIQEQLNRVSGITVSSVQTSTDNTFTGINTFGKGIIISGTRTGNLRSFSSGSTTLSIDGVQVVSTGTVTLNVYNYLNADVSLNGSLYCLGYDEQIYDYDEINQKDTSLNTVIRREGSIFCRNLTTNNLFHLNGNVVTPNGNVSSQEISYLAGITRNIQQQLDGVSSQTGGSGSISASLLSATTFTGNTFSHISIYDSKNWFVSG